MWLIKQDHLHNLARENIRKDANDDVVDKTGKRRIFKFLPKI